MEKSHQVYRRGVEGMQTKELHVVYAFKIFEKIVFIRSRCHKIARRYHQSLLELRDLCDQHRDKRCRAEDEWFIQLASAPPIFIIVFVSNFIRNFQMVS